MNGPQEESQPQQVGCWKKPSTWIKLGILLALLACIIVGAVFFDLGDKMLDLLEWLKEHKVEGFFIFAGIYLLATGEATWPPDFHLVDRCPPLVTLRLVYDNGKGYHPYL